MGLVTLIDSVVQCAKCNTPKAQGCDCWVQMTCPQCKRQITVERDPSDPPGTAEVRCTCNKCDKGDFSEVTYFNAAGKQIIPTP